MRGDGVFSGVHCRYCGGDANVQGFDEAEEMWVQCIEPLGEQDKDCCAGYKYSFDPTAPPVLMWGGPAGRELVELEPGYSVWQGRSNG